MRGAAGCRTGRRSTLPSPGTTRWSRPGPLRSPPPAYSSQVLGRPAPPWIWKARPGPLPDRRSKHGQGQGAGFSGLRRRPGFAPHRRHVSTDAWRPVPPRARARPRPNAPCACKISPSGLTLSSTQAFIAAMRPSRVTKSICSARMPNRRLRSARDLDIVGAPPSYIASPPSPRPAFTSSAAPPSARQEPRRSSPRSWRSPPRRCCRPARCWRRR